MYEVKLNQEQAEWLIHKDEIVRRMEIEREWMKKLIFGLADCLGQAKLTDLPIEYPAGFEMDEVISEVIERLNRHTPYQE